MTTCPRRQSYIKESVNSVFDAGWGMPLIFNDHVMKGSFYGFMEVCTILLRTYQLADNFLILQDDVVATMTAKEAVLHLFEEDFPILSLFNMNKELKPVQEGSTWMAGSLETERDRIKSCSGGISYLINRCFATSVAHRIAPKSWTPTPQRLADVCNFMYAPYAVTKTRIFEHIGKTSSLHPDKPEYRWDVSEAEPFRIK